MTDRPAPSASSSGQPVSNPGQTLGIVALVLAILPIGLQLVGFILGFVARNRSREANFSNGYAQAAIWISAALMVFGVTLFAVAVFFWGFLAGGWPPAP